MLAVTPQEVWGTLPQQQYTDNSSEGSGAKRATCSNHARMTLMSEQCKGKITLSGYEVQNDLRFFCLDWMDLGGVFWYLVVLHQYAEPGIWMWRFLSIFGPFCSTGQLPAREDAEVEDASPCGWLWYCLMCKWGRSVMKNIELQELSWHDRGRRMEKMYICISTKNEEELASQWQKEFALYK